MLRHGSNGNQNGFRLSTVFYKAYHTDVKLMKLVANALKTTEVSQRQLAEKIGVSHGTINNVMAGSLPKNIPTLQKFADYFHLTIDQLTHDEANPRMAEESAEYVRRHSPAQRIVKLLEQLDEEELATQAYDKPPEMLKKMVDGAKAARTAAQSPSNALK